MSKRKSSTKRAALVRPKPPRTLAEDFQTVQLVEYTITAELIESDQYKRLPARVRESVPQLYAELHKHPRTAIPKVQKLIRRYPRIPMFYNYLVAAYTAIGEFDKAKDIALQNYQRNPDYLFARINYAQVCMDEGHFNKIPEIFEETYDLKLLYPERDTFHVSEVVNFAGLMGLYFLAIGNRETAELYYSMAKNLGPKYPVTRQLHQHLHPSWLHGLLLRLIATPKS